MDDEDIILRLITSANVYDFLNGMRKISRDESLSGEEQYLALVELIRCTFVRIYHQAQDVVKRE